MDDRLIIKCLKVGSKVYKKITKLVTEQIGESEINDCYVMLKGDQIYGYVIFTPHKGKKKEDDYIYINWIYAKKGYGSPFLQKLEEMFSDDGYHMIKLHLSVGMTEKKDTVMRRLNYYSKHNYRVYDIKFRKNDGPLLSMKKLIKK